MENGVKLTNGYHNHHEDIFHKVNKTTKDPYVNSTDTLSGPNQVLPAESFTTTSPEGRVKLRITEDVIGAEPPLSVPGLLNRVATCHPDVAAFAVKQPDGTWKKTTFKEYKEQIYTCARAFLKLGLQRHHSVCILGFNSPQWFISDLGAIHAGGIATGIYTTNNSEACHHVLQNSRANIVVVQDTKQMDKIRAVWSRLPNLKAAIQWEGEIVSPTENMYSWDQLMEIGEKEPSTKLDEVMKTIAINECCTLVYTSGTVGNPKGVMLSHDNLVWESHAISETIQAEKGYERLVSFLPLSHVAAQIADIYVGLTNSVTIYFADKDALKGSLVKTLQEAEPTLFLGVPRVWEKIHEKMSAIGAANGLVKRTIAGWAKQKSLDYHLNKLNGIDYESYGYTLAKLLVLKKVKAALGFGKCRYIAAAAAPLSPEIKKYFLSLDIPIMDIFGMSEVSGAHTMSLPDKYSLESVGGSMVGVESKIDSPDPNTGHGEVCMRGRHVFMGYLGEPEKTDDAFDADGWVHSGDIGKIDEKGLIHITSRIKELIITAGGENVPPILIEQELKTELPFISHAMVVGDRKKFLSVLISFQVEVDAETGASTDKLNIVSKRWLKNVGSSAETVSDILKQNDKNVMDAIQDGISRANERAISNAQKVQKFTILPADFSVNTGELGPTMKMKRNVISQKYEELIEKMYK